MLVFLSSVALAGECRWVEVSSITTTMTTVTINGRTIPVRGRANWQPLVRDFQECDWYGAATALQKWRSNRQATNWTGLGGAALTLPTFGIASWALVATPFTAIAAGDWRLRMEQEVLRGSDERTDRLAQLDRPLP